MKNINSDSDNSTVFDLLFSAKKIDGYFKVDAISTINVRDSQGWYAHFMGTCPVCYLQNSFKIYNSDDYLMTLHRCSHCEADLMLRNGKMITDIILQRLSQLNYLNKSL